MQRFCASVAFAIALWTAPASGSPAQVDIVLQAHSLPPAADRIMRDEVARIWAREGITVTWRANEAQVPASSGFVRLMLLEGAPAPTPGARPALGQFLPDERRIRVAMPVVAAAAKSATAIYSTARGDVEYQRALGYVLGRVVAHELGHALLGTSHSDHGLMADAFDPAAIADGRDARFRLSATDAARLADRSRIARVASREPVLTDDTADVTDADLLAR